MAKSSLGFSERVADAADAAVGCWRVCTLANFLPLKNDSFQGPTKGTRRKSSNPSRASLDFEVVVKFSGIFEKRPYESSILI